MCAPVFAGSLFVGGPGAKGGVRVEMDGSASPYGYVIYEKHSRELLGNASGDYFCNQEGVCEQVDNSLIAKEGAIAAGAWISDANKAHTFEFVVPETGFYCLRLFNPDASPLTLKVYFVNPFGELRPELFPLLQLSGALTLLYGLCLMFWILASLHYRNTLPVQHTVALVLATNAAEMIVSYCYYAHTNVTGITSHALFLMVALVTAMRTTLSMFLVLVVSLGFGTVIPAMSYSTKTPLLILTAVHLLSSFVSIWSSLQGKTEQGFGFVFGSLPALITHFLYYVWILVALQETCFLLTARKQFIKLSMFQRLKATLLFFFSASLVLSLYSTFVMIRGRQGDMDWYAEHWKYMWLHLDGFPLLLNAIATLSLAYIWRPRQENRDYGLQQLPLDEPTPLQNELIV